MITKRIFRAFTITAMMITSTTMVEAQRINREGLQKLRQTGQVSSAASVQAPEAERNVQMAPAASQAHNQGASDGILAQGRKATAIVGSWMDTVSVSGGPTFKSLSTYTEEGLVVFNDQGAVITDPAFPHVFSAGHGVWVHQGGRTFSQTSLQYVSDLNGGLLFVNKIRQTLTLDESGDAYSVVWKAAFIDPDGNLVFSFEGTTEGKRINDEPL
jgi:hypothetical protein